MLDPHGLLVNVHPDLVKVITAASQSPQPFEVICGLRTLAAEQAAVASGHSQTMRSRHLPDANYGGVAMAVDIVALTGNPPHVAWEPSSLYAIIAGAVKMAARELNVPITWGGDWQTLRDLGHYELAWSKYP